MENMALQTMEILRKLEDFPDFFEILQTNEKLKKTVRRIEEDWIERSKPNKIDFLTNIVRKEEPHILKERTKMIENRLFKSFDEKYIRKIDVSLIKTQNKEHLRKMINSNYSLVKPLKLIKNQLNSNKNSLFFIDFLNKKVKNVLNLAEKNVYKLEFIERTMDFFNDYKEKSYKYLLLKVLMHEDYVLKNFIYESQCFLVKYQNFQFFLYKIAEIRFYRSLQDFKNSGFFIIIENLLFKNRFSQFLNEIDGILMENHDDFIHKSKSKFYFYL